MPTSPAVVAVLRQIETVRHYLHDQIGHPKSKALASAPEIALDILKDLIGDMPITHNETGDGRTIYVDLDGVITDFEGHFLRTFGVAHNSMTDDEMWDRINTVPDFFLTMPAIDGAIAFFNSLTVLNPTILSSCSKSDYQKIATQKREWVRTELPKWVTLLPVHGGASKPLFMNRPGDILIDDYRKNIARWEKAGGVGILHRNFEATRAALMKALIG